MISGGVDDQTLPRYIRGEVGCLEEVVLTRTTLVTAARGFTTFTTSIPTAITTTTTSFYAPSDYQPHSSYMRLPGVTPGTTPLEATPTSLANRHQKTLVSPTVLIPAIGTGSVDSRGDSSREGLPTPPTSTSLRHTTATTPTSLRHATTTTPLTPTTSYPTETPGTVTHGDNIDRTVSPPAEDGLETPSTTAESSPGSTPSAVDTLGVVDSVFMSSACRSFFPAMTVSLFTTITATVTHTM